MSSGSRRTNVGLYSVLKEYLLITSVPQLPYTFRIKQKRSPLLIALGAAVPNDNSAFSKIVKMSQHPAVALDYL